MAIIAAFSVPHPPMIVPEVGRGSEKQVRKTTESYVKVAEEIAALRPDTIIISSPHTVMYGDYFHVSPGKRAEGSFSGFGAADVRFSEEYDSELVNLIEDISGEEKLPCGTLGALTNCVKRRRASSLPMAPGRAVSISSSTLLC